MIWICDVENGYDLKDLLYTGRSSEERQIDLACSIVGQLAKPFVNSNRNVYTDCFFTSYSTVQHLSEHDFTAVDHSRITPPCSLAIAPRDLNKGCNRCISLVGFASAAASEIPLLVLTSLPVHGLLQPTPAAAEAKPTNEIQRLHPLLRSRGAIAREHGGVMRL
ncbi:hypothetical protein T03_5818 [Trichinella britovi]|uniref:PiggyBac transposable element-derived protein domain-containing protein n=1 Tax=Trichinella britovi TaxID=45882 RepID=A0A0V1C6T8_TRIBR|nr:hypothetical protein T03_5818 [Trichinella britovi]